MSDRDEVTYLDLLAAAEDALRALLLATEPGTGLLLHRAFAELKEVRAREQAAADVEALREHQREWPQLSLDERHRLVLAVLGAEQLTIREICEGLNDLRDDWTVYLSHVTSTVNRLHARNELHRVADRTSGRVRYRYFHPTELSGPIADLDRAFHDAD
jgi:hypothetical protein